MSGEPSDVRRFEAEFKKVAGTLSITATSIAWVPKESGSMDRQNQALNRAMAMFASKATSAKVQLKVTFRDDIPAGGMTFTFSASTAAADRSNVQDILIPYITANRAAVPAATPGGAVSAGPSTPATPAVGTPNGSASNKGKRKADEANGTPSSSTPGATRGKPPANVHLKKRVMNKNPTLKMLHRELVMGGQITEEEFWQGREALLQVEEMAYEQRPGRASRLLDDRFDLDSGRKSKIAGGGTGVGVKQKTEHGPLILNLSKELTREIFEEFPVVQDAYAKYVPGISEADFWARYFQSQLWERHRASVRQTANDEVSKKRDDIFDQYLEEPDWNVQPRAEQPDDVERFLDLAATEEDHGESITVRDFTMQAGRERSSLPLIRRFNDHSKKLLQAGGDRGNKKSSLSNSYVPDSTDIYDEIDLEDLRGPAQSTTIALDVQDKEDQTNGQGDEATLRGIMPGVPSEIPELISQELRALAETQISAIQTATIDFTDLSPSIPPGGWEANRNESGRSEEQAALYDNYASLRDASALAVTVVRDLHIAANEENIVNPPMPDNMMEQIRSCHNAATEFLRQYWSAILPTPAGALGAGTSATSTAARAAKAAKMAGYLKLTEGKVNAVVNTATMAGIDPGRIRAER